MQSLDRSQGQNLKHGMTLTFSHSHSGAKCHQMPNQGRGFPATESEAKMGTSIFKIKLFDISYLL